MPTRTAHLPATLDWSTWSQLFVDGRTWRPVVERICHGMGVTATTVKTGDPGTCAVFVVDRRVVVKLYPPLLPHDFAKERDVYRLLRNRLDRLPGLLAEGVYHDRIDWPYLVLEFCPGTPIRDVYGALHRTDEWRIAETLGRAVRTVHDTPLDGVTAFATDHAAWAAFLHRRRAECMGELQAETQLPATVRREIDAFLTTVLPELRTDATPLRLLHADLTEDHLLLVQDDAGWRVSALLDWADAEVGAPPYEWIALWFGLCNRNPAFFHNVLRAYDPGLALDERFYRHALAYTFLHRFGAGIIDHVWRADGSPTLDSLAMLQRWLWLQMQ